MSRPWNEPGDNYNWRSAQHLRRVWRQHSRKVWAGASNPEAAVPDFRAVARAASEGPSAPLDHGADSYDRWLTAFPFSCQSVQLSDLGLRLIRFRVLSVQLPDFTTLRRNSSTRDRGNSNCCSTGFHSRCKALRTSRITRSEDSLPDQLPNTHNFRECLPHSSIA